MAINKRLIKSNEGGVAVPTSFNTLVYTGTNTSGTRDLTGFGFDPDFVWVKNRVSLQNHVLVDIVRGAGSVLQTSTTAAERANFYGGVSAFITDGVTLQGTIDTGEVNYINQTYVAWGWKAGGAAVATGGTNLTNRLVSANPEAGFSIMTKEWPSPLW